MVELLAPAGSEQALKAAVNAGCDAVYIGGSSFGARAYADNPDTEGLKRCIDYCHIHEKKIFLTVNTLFKEKELTERLCDYLSSPYREGLDAVIVQDIGAMRVINDNFPGLDIHVSTQAAVMTAYSACELKRRFPNITRVVPGRELSLSEIGLLCAESGLETEVFVHGALCYCYSGQCLLSSMIGGRSGNRGRCAQPCRKLYNGRCLLSPKDICELGHIAELIDAGVDSFKIEGRMKSAEYAAGVVDVYRREIDRYYSEGHEAYLADKERLGRIEKGEEKLRELYNRGGFSDGYLFKHNGREMMSLDRSNHSGVKVGEVIKTRQREAVIRFDTDIGPGDVLEIRDNEQAKRVYEYTAKDAMKAGTVTGVLTMKGTTAAASMPVFRTRNNSLLNAIDEAFVEKEAKIPVDIKFYGHSGEAVKLTLTYCGNPLYTATSEGKLCGTAQNRPADEESILKQLSRLGDTPFVISSYKIDIGQDVFLPASELNELRRRTVDELLANVSRKFRRNPDSDICSLNNVRLSSGAFMSEDPVSEDEVPCIFPYGKSISASVYDNARLEAVLGIEAVQDVYFNITSFLPDTCTAFAEKCLKAGKKPFIGLPYVCRYELYDRVEELVRSVHSAYPEAGFVVRNLEELTIIKKYGCLFRTDQNVYAMNRTAAKELDAYITLPTELNLSELKELSLKNSELTVYGYQPVMFSAQCSFKNSFGKCSGNVEGFVPFDITDDTGHTFMTLRECCFCTNIIYNSVCLNLTEEEAVKELPCRSLRFDFTVESPEEIRNIFREDFSGHYTFGHFKRGVE